MDNSICINNIYAIAKSKGIKIGDLEESAELSKGYLARIRRDGEAFPAVEKLYAIAKKLKVSMDALLTGETGEMSPDDTIIFQFLEKLYDDSKNHHVSWDRNVYSGGGDDEDNSCDAACMRLINHLCEDYHDDYGCETGVRRVAEGTFHTGRLPGTDTAMVISRCRTYFSQDISDPESYIYKKESGIYLVGECIEAVWTDAENSSEILKASAERIFNLLSGETHKSAALKSKLKSYLEYDLSVHEDEAGMGAE